MMYRAYKERLEKRKRTFDRLWHFRYLFLAIFLLLLATAATLLGVGGMVYDTEILSSNGETSLVYGQTPVAFAKAVYGTARFEYRALPDGEWQKDVPYRAGEYECRAIGRSVAKTDRRGRAVAFTIQPLPVKIGVVGESLTFGERPQFFAPLCYGDELRVENWTSEPEDGRLELCADLSHVRVVDADGEDVTFCYTFEAEKKSIADVDRPAVVRTESQTVVYDGQPHSLACSALGLAAGHTLEAEVNPYVEAGMYRSAPVSYRILNEAGEDVTAHYNVSVEIGTLTVEKRRVALETVSETFVYDGKEHSYPVETVVAEGTFPAGQSLAQTQTPVFRDAGEYSNRPAFAVFEGEEERTRNYELVCAYGTVRIQRRAVNYLTQSNGWVYDGTAHSEGGFETEEESEGRGLLLSLGHTAQAVGIPYISTVRESGKQNTFRIRIFDASESDVTENYDPLPTYGTLTLTARPIAVTTQSGEWVYDGAYHSESGIQAEEESEGRGLISLHAARAVNAPRILLVSESGAENKFPVEIFAAGVNVTNNYDITYTYGTLTITRRPVTAYAMGDSLVYDGAAHTYGADTLTTGETGLAEGDLFQITGGTYSFTDAGEHTNAPEVKIVAGNADRTENYVLDVLPETVAIARRPLSYRTRSNGWVYDGAPHFESGFSFDPSGENEGIVPSHEARAVDVPSISTVKESGTENAFDLEISDAAGRDVTENYAISPTYGRLTMSARPIHVATQPQTWLYDGVSHAWNGFDAEKESEGRGLVSSHKAQAADAPSITNVRESGKANAFAVTISDASGDVTENYSISYTYGALIITPRPVAVTTASHTWVYDGEAHRDEKFSVASGENAGLVLSHEASQTTDAPTVMNVADSRTGNNVFSVGIFDGEENVSDNYNIAYEYGTLTLTRRPVAFLTASNAWTYDGGEHWDEGFICTSSREDEGLVLSHRGALKSSAPRVTTVADTRGKTENNIFELFISDGEDVSDNYNIAYEYGTLTIQPRSVTVTTQSDTLVYDGREHTYGADTLKTGETGLAAGESFRIAGGAYRFIGAGKHENHPDVEIFSERGETTENYLLNFTYGSVGIGKRPVSVTTQSGEWVYDGKPHQAGFQAEAEREGNGLISFHTAQAVDQPNITFVRESGKENKFTVEIFDAGANVTENYEITYSGYGTLTIARRLVTVTSQSDSFVYDGKAHSYGESTLTAGQAGLAESDLFQITGGTYSFTDAGEHTNAPEVKIVSGEDDRTENYSVTQSNGTIKIERRPVLLSTASHEWVYDGKAHWDERVLVTVAEGYYAIAEGQEFKWTATSYTTVTKVKDSRENAVEGTPAVFAEDKEVTKNYLFKYGEKGMLTVMPRPVLFRTASHTWVYDGEGHSDAGFECTSSRENEGLVLSHAVALKSATPTVMSVADTRTGNNVFAVGIFDGEADVSENYEIAYDYGTLTITPRPIAVITGSGEWVYDGKPHTVETDFGYQVEGGEIEGHTYSAQFKEFCNVSRGTPYPNECIFTVADGASDVTGNYQVTYHFGEIIITPRPIAVTTGSGEWVYDGVPHSESGFEAEEESEGRGLVSSQDHRAQAVNLPHITNVTESDMENNFLVEIFDALGANVTENYEIAYTYGTLTIVPRPVTVTTASHTWAYDGADHFDGGFTAEEERDGRGLLGADRGLEQLLSYTTVREITDSDSEIGTVPNELTVTFGDNYLVDYVYGKLRVKPPIVVRLYTEKAEYDGNPHTYSGKFKIQSLPLDVKKEDVTLTVRPTMVEPGAMTCEEIGASFAVKGDPGLAENRFVFEGAETPFAVTPRKITVASQSVAMRYSGKPIQGWETQNGKPYFVSRGSLLFGHTLECAVNGVLDGSMSYADNTFDEGKTVIRDEYGNDVTRYYEIRYSYGTLEWIEP